LLTKVDTRIETQDVILRDIKAERVVEVGPGSTLLNMAKRTIASKYSTYDAANSIHRQLLSCQTDRNDIYYSHVPQVEDKKDSGKESKGEKQEIIRSGTAVEVVPTQPEAVSTHGIRPTSSVTDAPVPVIAILRTMIAQLLKKRIEEVEMSNSLKELAGGSY
jgi:fatty acid synthase subunit alpha